MKMKLSFAILTAVGLAATGARATTLNLTVDPNLPPTTTAYVLGAINPGVPADAVDQAAYINTMLTLALGGQTTVTPNGNTDTIYRSMNTFSGLPAAGTVTANGNVTGTANSGYTLTTGYEFLVAKYDGPNGGTEVWDIASLKAGDSFTIPQNAFGSDNSQYGLSGWTLLDPNATPSVPDGGLTVAMLGAALSGLALLRKKLS